MLFSQLFFDGCTEAEVACSWLFKERLEKLDLSPKRGRTARSLKTEQIPFTNPAVQVRRAGTKTASRSSVGGGRPPSLCYHGCFLFFFFHRAGGWTWGTQIKAGAEPGSSLILEVSTTTCWLAFPIIPASAPGSFLSIPSCRFAAEDSVWAFLVCKYLVGVQQSLRWHCRQRSRHGVGWRSDLPKHLL